VDNAIALGPAPLPRYAPSVFGVFLLTQVLDGLFTYWGVTTFGVGVEANVLLATSIEAIGAPRALLSAKLLASVCGYILYCASFYRTLSVATGLYVGVAIVPWLAISSMFHLWR
jgi:hypothetical protein